MKAAPGAVAAPSRVSPWRGQNVKGSVCVQNSLHCHLDETTVILVLFLQFIMPLAYFSGER